MPLVEMATHTPKCGGASLKHRTYVANQIIITIGGTNEMATSVRM